jgi:uncharacterized protein YbaR (Trm112 family)
VELNPELLAKLVCPACKGPLALGTGNDELICRQCKLSYPIEDGIPALMVSAAKKLD